MTTEESLRTAAQVASFADALCTTKKKKNEWKIRMLSTQHGVHFPIDFDTLSEDERERRLDKAIEIALPPSPREGSVNKFDKDRLTMIFAGEGDYFTAMLLRLIARSDSKNRAKLFRGFPEEVDIVHQYQTGKEFRDER